MFAKGLEELPGRTILNVASGPWRFVAEAIAMGMDSIPKQPTGRDGAAR